MEQLKFILISGGVETVLINSPAGWEDMLINRIRSDVYFSVSEKVTTKLPFPLDGKKILKTLFYNFGFEAVCGLRIEQLVNATQFYTAIFTGEINFSTFKDDDELVDVICTEGSFWEKLKANESTEYEIDIDSNNPVDINCVFPKLLQKQTYDIGSENVYIQSDADKYVVEITSSNSEIYQESSKGLSVPVRLFNNFPVASPDRFFIANVPIFETKIKIDLGGEVKLADGILWYYVNITNFTNTYTYYSKRISINTVLSPQIQHFTIHDEVNIGNLPAGTDLFLTVSFPNSYRDSGSPFYIPNTSSSIQGTVEVSYLSAIADKTIRGLRPITILNSLLKQMNPAIPGVLSSDHIPFDNTFVNIIKEYIFTSGDAVRGLTGSKIKTTFKDFYNSLNNIWGVGFGYENNKAILREKEYFFKNTLIADVGEVANFKLEIYKTHIFNSVKVGYEEQTYDEINGKFEANQAQQWTLPISKIPKAGDLISKYRTDVLGIIMTSLNLDGKETTDASSDNDTFIIHKQASPLNGLWRENFPCTGVSDPTGWFNVDLSPKRNLLRSGNFINSFLHKIPGTAKIIFQTATKNSDFTSRLNTETIRLTEKEDILVSSLPAPLFQPDEFSCDVVVNKDFNTIINSKNPHGYIQFTWKGIIYKGFINDIGVNPANNSQYNLKLISHPDNDLTQLI